jgi:hypothetical protein
MVPARKTNRQHPAGDRAASITHLRPRRGPPLVDERNSIPMVLRRLVQLLDKGALLPYLASWR